MICFIFLLSEGINLFSNENGYFSGFMCCLICYFLKLFCFFYLHLYCIVFCIELSLRFNVFLPLDSGCSHSVAVFVLTTV
jgi:hypothetical protein